ncbi:MAG: GNAT family N-acetyltransferase [Butyrivibrio sp.]|nr:GNAT family N-acetyltransferase [Butyrivibrio sp.]
MLREIFFALKDETFLNREIMTGVDETIKYFEDNGFTALAISMGDFHVLNIDKEKKKSVLVLCDDAAFSGTLSDEGFYVAGILHEGSAENFEGLKYVFSDLTQVEMDSFIKVYQRYAGEPWEILRTERLIVRETTVDDVDEFYRIYKDPEMTRYMEGLFEDPADEKRYQADYIKKVYEFMGFGVWTVIRKEDGRIIGRAGYSVRKGFDEIELGFLIGKEFQRQGYAYEVCAGILDYGRDVLLFDKVRTLVKKDNTASVHLCEKLGFRILDEIDVEENIYGGAYDTDGKVTFGPDNYGTYVRMVRAF